MKIFLTIAMAVIAIAYAVDDRAWSDIQEQGLVVQNWKGEYIGTSRHAVLDSSTAKIVLIIVSLGKEEKKEIAVPPGFFSVDKKNEVLILSINKKELDSAPEYDASNMEDPEFVKKVYRFFGLLIPQARETQKEKMEHA